MSREKYRTNNHNHNKHNLVCVCVCTSNLVCVCVYVLVYVRLIIYGLHQLSLDGAENVPKHRLWGQERPLRAVWTFYSDDTYL